MIMMEGSQKKRAAADFMIWSLHGDGAPLFARQAIFPPLRSIQESPDFITTRMPLYGDQELMRVLVESANQVDPSMRFSPFEDFVDAVFIEETSAAAVGKGTPMTALDRVQDRVVEFATRQGLTCLLNLLVLHPGLVQAVGREERSWPRRHAGSWRRILWRSWRSGWAT